MRPGLYMKEPPFEALPGSGERLRVHLYSHRLLPANDRQLVQGRESVRPVLSTKALLVIFVFRSHGLL